MQPLFARLHSLTLSGLGYGYGADATGSGEVFLLNYLRNKGAVTVFDVGANVGLYCQLVKESLGSASRVYCFEPVPGTRKMLLENVSGMDGVTVLDFGLGETPGKLDLFLDTPGATTATAYESALTGLGTRTAIVDSITIKRLDDTFRELGIESLDLLKIDVEGFELSVLKGAGELLKSGRIRAIQFEFGPFHIFARTFLRDFYDLLAPNYTIYRVTENSFVPCGDWNPSLEVFLTTNYLAEWRES